MEKLYSPEEAAAWLKVKPAAVRKWLRNGTLRASKLGNVWRIPESSIEEFMRETENRPAADGLREAINKIDEKRK